MSAVGTSGAEGTTGSATGAVGASGIAGSGVIRSVVSPAPEGAVLSGSAVAALSLAG